MLCWGFGEDGRLGYGETDEEGDEATIGDDEDPGSVAPVQIGAGRTATAISAGGEHTCVLPDDQNVRCWGTNGSLFGGDGRLGYGNAATIGDNETPGSVAPVALGGPATAVSAGNHTCARLVSGAARCWGPGLFGRLGYANTSDIGDDETPGSLPAVMLGGSAAAISTGTTHTCAKLGDATLRCWGEGLFGRLGYGNANNVDDDETPAAAGPINFDGLPPIPPVVVGGGPGPGPAPEPAVVAAPTPRPPTDVADPLAEGLRLQARRAADLRSCRASAASKLRAARSGARRRYRQPRVLARVLRVAATTAARRRAQCLKRFGRTPGRVTSLAARSTSRSTIVLKFDATGTDGVKPPAAQSYVIKQSLRPIRTARDFDRAMALCSGTCRFDDVTILGTEFTLTVNDLPPRTTHYYAIAARDNVSARRGPRSKAVSATTR